MGKYYVVDNNRNFLCLDLAFRSWLRPIDGFDDEAECATWINSLDIVKENLKQVYLDDSEIAELTPPPAKEVYINTSFLRALAPCVAKAKDVKIRTYLAEIIIFIDDYEISYIATDGYVICQFAERFYYPLDCAGSAFSIKTSILSSLPTIGFMGLLSKEGIRIDSCLNPFAEALDDSGNEFVRRVKQMIIPYEQWQTDKEECAFYDPKQLCNILDVCVKGMKAKKGTFTDHMVMWQRGLEPGQITSRENTSTIFNAVIAPIKLNSSLARR